MTSWSQVLLLSHLANLDKVLGILATSGLKFNNSKRALMLPKVEYLGHVIDGLGLHPTKDKVKAIQEAQQPHNVTELRSFLGIIIVNSCLICQQGWHDFTNY